jgi:hypothetical protein
MMPAVVELPREVVQLKTLLGLSARRQLARPSGRYPLSHAHRV